MPKCRLLLSLAKMEGSKQAPENAGKKRKTTLFDFSFSAKKVASTSASNVSDDKPESEIEVVEEASNSGEVEMREERVGGTAVSSASEAENEMEENEVSKAKPSTSSNSKSKTFQKSWTLKWPWLENTGDGMRCTLCTKHKKWKVFTRPGCFNFGTSTMERHVETADHQQALKGDVQQKGFQKVGIFNVIWFSILKSFGKIRFASLAIAQ
jgi:hypothetical protein